MYRLSPAFQGNIIFIARACSGTRVITDLVTGTWPYPIRVRVADHIISVPGLAAV